MEHWNKKIIVTEICKSHRADEKLNSDHAQTCRPRLYQAACRYFGSWKQAIEAAGLSYDQVKIKNKNQPRIWSRQKLIDVILDLWMQGEPINSNHIQIHHARIYAASLKYFGSWPKLIEAAGIDYSKIRRKKPDIKWTQELVVSAIIEYKKQGVPLTTKGVPAVLLSAARRMFGRNPWTKALRKAGVDPKSADPRRIWTKTNIVAEIQRLHSEGVPLNCSFLNKNNDYRKLYTAGRKIFGNWQRAISVAGLDYAQIRKARKNWWTKKRVLARIRQFDAAGVRLSLKTARRLENGGGLIYAAGRYFGSWSQAVGAAGIDYRLHAKVWSTKAWIRKLNNSTLSKVKRQVDKLSQSRRT